jgi:hypothetical protein
MAVEEPPYKTVLADGAFEVRDYPALTVAQVTVPGSQNQAANTGFRLLAHYIFGGNTGKQSIAMTAPVALRPAGERIAEAPVAQMADARSWTVQFVMPGGRDLANLPRPDDPRVKLGTIPPTREAVLRFSGWAFAGPVKAKTAQLMALVASHHLHPEGGVSLAQYDPPWTLPFLRRNEVMIPVAR